MITKSAQNKKYNLIFMIFTTISISIIVSILIAFDNGKPDHYRLLWLMPLTFSFLCIILFNFKAIFFYRVTTMLAFGLYFIRMVVSPLAMFLGEYSSYGYGSYVEAYSNAAISLMCYEAIIVFTFMILNLKKLSQKNILELQYTNDSKSVKLPVLFKLAIFSFIMFLLLIIFSNPSLIRSNFVFLVGTPDNWVVQQEYASLDGSGSGTLGIFVTLMNTVFWFIQALLPPAILLRISQKKISYRRKIGLSLLLLISVLLIATETRASSVESAIALLIIMSLIFGRKFSNKIPLLIGMMGIVVIFGLFSKGGTSFDYIELSKTLTAYFSGPQNLAIAIGISKEYSSLNLLMLPIDIVMKIPYVSSILRPIIGYTTNDYFNTAFANLYGRNIGQIIPAIGQGYVYFWYVLAPLVPIVVVGIAMNFEKKARDEHNIIFKYLFYLAAIMMSRATVISNMMSGVTYLFNIFLVYFIASSTIKYWSFRRGANYSSRQPRIHNYKKLYNLKQGGD